MNADVPALGRGAPPPVAITRTTNEDVRAQNLSAVLRLVHAAGAQSRSRYVRLADRAAAL